MNQTALPQRTRQGGLGGGDQPGRAVGDDQQWWAQPPPAQFVEEIPPGISGLGTPGGQCDEHRCPVGGDAPRGQHRLGPGTGMHLEHRGVQEQILQLQGVQAPGRPRRELLTDHLADPRDRRLRQRRLGTEGIGEGVLHIADRQPAHEPGDHQRLQRMGLGDTLTEQRTRERLSGAPQLRPRHRDRPRRRLDRRRAEPVAASRPPIRAPAGTLVAGAAQEHLDLSLHSGLDDQPRPQTRDVLDDLRQLTRPVEQSVDLAADLLDR